MKANTASKTAQYMALFRSIETARPRSKRLFNDPYAIHFLGGGLKLASRTARLPLAASLINNIIQHKIPGALTSGIARTKYIDDLLQQSIEDGAQQVIILGAGFDTRTLRLDYLQSIPVIEIDHPDTATLKLDILRAVKGYLPSNTRYLQINFNTQSLEQVLADNAVDLHIPTTIIWEGVTNYLSPAAIGKTFGLLQQCATGSYIIFTYVDKRVLECPADFFGAVKLLHDLDAIEERWTFGFDPVQLPAYLEQFGYRLLQDAGAAQYRAQYMPERKSLNKGYEFYRVAFCRKHL